MLLYPEYEKNIHIDRMGRLRKKMETAKASLCVERAVYYTESFKNTEDESYILRKAKAFRHTLKNMTIYIEPDSLVFGNLASKNFAAPIYCEYSIQWILDELDTFEKRKGDVFQVDEETKRTIRELAPYWVGHTHEDEVNRNMTESIDLACQQGVLHRGGISMSGDGHVVIDHEMVLKRGLRSLLEEAKQYPSTDYYQAVCIVLEAALAFFKRYASLAFQLANQCEDPLRKQEYEQMAQMASSLLERPARSFYEGIEAIYMLHILQSLESNGHSFCYGRFDQYMWDLYQKDLERNVLTKEKALELITHFFIMNASLNKVRPYGHTKFSQGYPLYTNLVVGGMKKDGQDGTNELSYLCIEAMHLCSLSEPNFSARMHSKTPRDFVRACTKLIATGCGSPSLFNDEVVSKGLMGLGIPKEEALDYCPIGCVETGVQGKYGHRATGMTYVNWGKVLEILLHNGKDPRTGIVLLKQHEGNGAYSVFESYEDLWNTWKKYLKFYTDLSVACDRICDASLVKYDADPFCSCLIQDSLKLGKTLKQGGCRYDVISQSNIGSSVVGNSLYSLKKLVFDEKKIRFDDFMQVLDSNWKTMPLLQNICLKQAKFGNDIDEVDEIVADVFASYLDLLPQYNTLRKNQGPSVSCYTMSTSNITSYVPNGLVVGATPDGRMAGSVLNEGCSPTQQTDCQGPTALINSVSKLPNDRVAAGQLLNMRFSKDVFAGEKGIEKFVDFIYVCLCKGIYHNQFNVVSSKDLLEAMQYPEKYTNLLVRVAGYCAQFISLMEEAQIAIVERTENTL